MEDVPHPASVLTTKSSLRASRFFKKVSQLRGKFNNWTRRKDEHRSPYSHRNAQSMDTEAHAKRWMSQPCLGMKPYPPDAHRSARHMDSDDSPSPSSSNHSPVHMSRLPNIPHSIRQQTDADASSSAPVAIEGLPPPSIGDPIPITRPRAEPKQPGVKAQKTLSQSESTQPAAGDTVQPVPKKSPQMATGASIHTRSSTLPPTLSSSRRHPAPHLNGLPPTQRFSLTESDRGMVRLSPVITARQPPMPISNLPTLTSRYSASIPRDFNPAKFKKSQSLARLRHMPSLPIQGSTEEPTGAAGDDDDHDVTVEDDEDDDSEEENFEDALEGAGSDDGEDGDAPRPSMSTVVTAESSLPQIDTSKTEESLAQDLRLSRTPSKDKGKAREEPVERTPTLTNPTYDYFSTHLAGTSSSHSVTPRQKFTPSRTPGGLRTVPMPWDSETKFVRPSIYQQASKSMIDIISPARQDSIIRDEHTLKGSDAGLNTAERRPLLRQDTSNDPNEPLATRQKRLSTAPTQDGLGHSLRRRQSLPTFTAGSPPPPYPSFAPFHKSIIMPREDEGKEKLPPYTNDIYLKAIMPRKMEFIKPGVQARDRKWRRVLCELEGTVFRVYKCPPGVAGVGAFSEWWESKVGVGDISSSGPNPPSTRNKEAERARSLEIGQRAKLEEEARSLETTQGRRSVDDVISSSSAQPRATSPQMPPIIEHESSSSSVTKPEGNRSKLRNLLKPSRSHGRSQSDAVNSLQLRSSPSTPRSSFNELRPSGSGGLRPSARSPPDSRRSSDAPKPSLVTANRSSDGASGLEPDSSNLLRTYTLQGAESGLGNDYVKRKCVIRVRMEGEQFLLQGKDIPEVIEWIEGFQAAANIALDLDTRPMPRGPLFPRRRRRRVVAQTNESSSATQS